MVLFIVLCLFCLGIYIWYAIDEGFYSFTEGALRFLLVILGWTLSASIVCLTSTITDCCVAPENKTYEITSTHSIVALKDNPNITGHFFLFSGYEDEELYYHYAEETELGIRTDKIHADNSYIIYENREPRIEQYDATKFKHWWHYIYAVPLDTYYKIYVPEGTVSQEFKVNLE